MREVRIHLCFIDQGRDRSSGRGPCDELVSVELGPAQCAEQDTGSHLPGIRGDTGETGRRVSLPPRGQPVRLQSAVKILSLYHTRIRFCVTVAPGIWDANRQSSTRINAEGSSRRERRGFQPAAPAEPRVLSP